MLLIAHILVAVLFILGPMESALLGRVFEAATRDAPDTNMEAAIADRDG